jgi:prophage antirepressor-like protein/DNA-binding XRE family transcriptional regulator
MNQFQIFNYQSKEIRTVVKDGDPWWIAKDVCEALDIDTSNLTKILDEDERDTYPVQYTDQVRNTAIINEPGLYSLVLKSRKPEAKTFKRWITHEVIPQIRKTGSYAMQPQTDNPLILALIDFDHKLQNVESRQQSLEEQLEELRQKVSSITPVISEVPGTQPKTRNRNINSKLRRFREEKGLTIKTVAEKTGISESFLAEVERGTNVPSMKNVHKIAEVLEITPSKFVALLS